MRKGFTLEKTFFSKIVINPASGCWEWTGCKNEKGYGLIGVAGRVEKTPMSKITTAQAKEIIMSKGSSKDLAEKYGTSSRQIRRIRSRKDWKHVIIS